MKILVTDKSTRGSYEILDKCKKLIFENNDSPEAYGMWVCMLLQAQKELDMVLSKEHQNEFNYRVFPILGKDNKNWSETFDFKEDYEDYDFYGDPMNWREIEAMSSIKNDDSDDKE